MAKPRISEACVPAFTDWSLISCLFVFAGMQCPVAIENLSRLKSWMRCPAGQFCYNNGDAAFDGPHVSSVCGSATGNTKSFDPVIQEG